MKGWFAGGRLVLCLGLSLAACVPAIARGPESVAGLARELAPTVVNISSTHHVEGGSGVEYPEGAEGSALDDLFNSVNPNVGDGGRAAGEAESLGSGFIFSADGLIVTNNHVIEGADSVVVYLADGERLPARVVGVDTETDLAVLRVAAGHPLKFVKFGDSDKAEVGDWVMAIGNPFGLGGSVTLGIVSARNRDIRTGPYDSYIQTDASINQGNSGGPLFDMAGKVVGVNTAIVARGGASLGIGFAVPSNMARTVVDEIVEYGHVRHAWIGVGVQQVTPDIASSLGLGSDTGALVVSVAPQSPADGVLREGDLILDFDGHPIATMHDLPRIVALAPIGRSVPVEVMREGEKHALEITPGPEPAAESSAAKNASPPAVPDVSGGPQPVLMDLVGFEVAPIDAGARARYSLDLHRKGVVIVDVLAGSDAGAKGLVPGAVIDEVNQQKVTTVAEVSELVGQAREAGRPAVLLKILDPTGASRFVAIRLRG